PSPSGASRPAAAGWRNSPLVASWRRACLGEEASQKSREARIAGLARKIGPAAPAESEGSAEPGEVMTMVAAVTTDGAGITLSDPDVDGLRSALRGELIGPDHVGYETARRVWNGNVDRRPALVARCAGVADVQQAVGFARAHRLAVSVRGGGHSAPGY